MKKIAFIIEDNIEIASIFSRALIGAGFEPDVIPNGKDALERLQYEAPHLVILDMNLPGVNGEVILDFIRSKDHLAYTKVIVATADAQFGYLQAKKADLVLEKPVTFSQMRDFAKLYAAENQMINTESCIAADASHIRPEFTICLVQNPNCGFLEQFESHYFCHHPNRHEIVERTKRFTGGY